MRIPLNWLNDFVDIDGDAGKLAYDLTMAGIETVPLRNVSVDENVVASKILSIEKHPNADKLSVCNVTDGQKEYRIVCGAKNIKVGDIAPLAKVGARLSGGEIKKAVLRGVESSGMLCSSAELEIGDDASGIFILPDNISPGTTLNEYLRKDLSVETEITINRGDCLSVYGIAREVSAIYNKKLKKEIKEYPPQRIKPANIFPVSVENSKSCPRYTGILIKDVKIGESPGWLIEKLRSCGLREINNIVDITNYILLEYGQPLHAFDSDKINGKIIIRDAKKNEKISALDNKEYILHEGMLVIADEKDPIAIAGIIGGESRSVTENTKNIFLEAACFDPISIRKTAGNLAVSTDSSYRFIRGIDIKNVPNVSMIAAEMIQKICGGKIDEGIIDIYPESRLGGIYGVYSHPNESVNIELNVKKVNNVLGSEISPEEIKSILTRLGFSYSLLPTPYSLSVSVPSHRNDVRMDVDLIEEVARIYGYNKIKTNKEVRYKIDYGQTESDKEKVIAKIREISTSLGFYEMVSYNFISKNDLVKIGSKEDVWEIANPIAASDPYLATSLIPWLIKNTARNINRGNDNIRFFEIGRVFGNKEKTFFSGCVSGYKTNWWKEKSIARDFYFMKGFIEMVLCGLGIKSWKFEKNTKDLFHANHSADIFISNAGSNSGSVNVGSCGMLSPEVSESYEIKNEDLYVFELDMEELVRFSDFSREYSAIPRFPSVKRDISIEVPGHIPAYEISEIIKKEGGDILVDVNVSDFYVGKQIKEGNKSLSFSMKFRLPDRTLKDKEVDSAINKVILQLEKKFKAALR
ncbi:MAG: phenylalanine--tRNA ligase subunit beta [Elusimicrobia bacterium]|nr:phenylalanine--tRNA ligase subunit beta [Elusimicrobiota bacterium]